MKIIIFDTEFLSLSKKHSYLKNLIKYKKKLFPEIIQISFLKCSNIYFKNGLSSKLHIMVGEINNKTKPTHQLKIVTDKKIYFLKTKLNSLKDKFKLIERYRNSKKELIKTIFKEKNNGGDFRIYPTFKNSEKFSNWILKGRKQSPNFFDSQRIHLVIKKMIGSWGKKNERYL